MGLVEERLRAANQAVALQVARWVDEEFPYTGYTGTPARCGIKVFQPRGKPAVVVCTELPDNEGLSVTNAAEKLATLVARFKGLASFVWVEHYVDRAFCGNKPGAKESFDVVTFSVGDDGDFFHPRWYAVSLVAVEELIRDRE